MLKKKVYAEIKESWYRCYTNKISKTLNEPLLYVEDDELQILRKNNKDLIDIFLNNSKKLVRKYCHIGGILILTDKKGVLLSHYTQNEKNFNLENDWLRNGIIFSEKSFGTNAVSMTMETDSIIHLNGDEHYCYFLHNWEFISLPIKCDKKIYGYLAIANQDNNFNNKIYIFLDLLHTKISSELKEEEILPFLKKRKNLNLSGMSKNILILSANGVSIKNISKRLNVSVSTVKYHRKKIFGELNASGIPNAIAKAIKYGYLSLTDID